MPDSLKMSNVFTKKSPFGDEEGEFTAPPGYKAYHGTNSENVETIIRDGLRGRGEDGAVCFTEDPDVCEDYGDVTIEADLSGMKIERFWDEGEADGQHSAVYIGFSM